MNCLGVDLLSENNDGGNRMEAVSDGLAAPDLKGLVQ